MNFDLATSMQVLSRTPPTISAFLGGLSDAWLRANEGPNTFSPFDVVGHLIDGEAIGPWRQLLPVVTDRPVPVPES